MSSIEIFQGTMKLRFWHMQHLSPLLTLSRRITLFVVVCLASFISGHGQVFDFSVENHGFQASSGGTSDNKAPFVYDDGKWTTEGVEGGTGKFATSTLTSPSVKVSGRVEITIAHEYFFEADWDSAHLEIVVNGSDTFRAGVDLGQFIQRGYDKALPAQGSNPEKDKQVWTGEGRGDVLSHLVIENLPKGSEISLKFVATWDDATLAEGPNWTITRIDVVSEESQPTEPKTWIVDKDPSNASARFPDLQTAVNETRSGDTILLMPSAQSYGDATINKSLTILGGGFGGGDVLSLARHKSSITGVINIAPGTSDVVLSGLTIARVSFLAGGGISNILLFRNHVFSFVMNSNFHTSIFFTENSQVNGVYLINNWIDHGITSRWKAGIVENVYILNNVVNSHIRLHMETSSHAIIKNNVFPSINSSLWIQSGVFAFNIIHREQDINWREPWGQTYLPNMRRQGNLYAGALPKYIEGDTSFTPLPLENGEVFAKQFSDVVALEGKWWEQFVLTADSPAKGLSADGSDAGIFGGDYPWDTEQMPPFPFVTDLVAPAVVTQGLPMRIEVEVQTNN